MLKLYVVEYMKDLSNDENYYKTDAKSAQEAVDLFKDWSDGNPANRIRISNVFVETEESWEV